MKKLPIIEKGIDGGMSFNRKWSKRSIKLLVFYLAIIVVCFFSITLRLFQLSVVKGEYYRQLSENNRIREVVIEPKRGIITDRKGIVIASNSTYENSSDNYRISSKRNYLNPEANAHIIGYRQVADSSDIESDPCIFKINSGDKIGKRAVEKHFECELRGKNGKQLIEINAQGKFLRTLSQIPPVDGKTIQLSIDEYLQNEAYESIKDKRAVVVATKPDTGEILTLASSPSYNIQAFEEGNSKETSIYIKDQNKPLFNRATEGAYPPGSTFKLVISAAALEEKVVDRDTTIEDTGTIKAGTHSFGNWYYLEYGKTEGLVDMVKAIKRSNDIYFYKIGEKLGPSNIKKWSERFGYGKISDLPLEEKSGIIPFPFWKEETLKEKWFLGDTYNLSIGQGYLNVTPLQVAAMTSVFANNGRYCRPTILKLKSYLADTEGNCSTLPLTKDNIKVIQEGMVDACSTGGTGWPFFDFSVNSASGSAEKKHVQVACKTGTAESHAESGIPHAWFTVYAPSEDPEIVVTVLVEEAGQGSDIAAPIAKDLLKKYFERE